MVELLKKCTEFFLVAALVIIVGCWYGRSTQLFFVQDDFVWLWKAQEIWQNWRLLFQTDISGFFMPLISAYFAGVEAIVGASSASYHALNVAWHALNTVLVFYFAKYLTRQSSLSFVAALLFATFRFPADTILWVSAVTELISTTLLLVAGLAWGNYLKNHQRSFYAVACISALLLAFAKEWACLLLPLFVWLGAWEYAQQKEGEKKAFLRRIAYAILPFIALTIVYFGFQFWLQHAKNPLLVRGHYALGGHIITNELGNLFLTMIPFVSQVRAYPVYALVASSGFFLAMLLVGVWRWRRSGDRLPLFSLAWMVVSFLPTAFFTWDPYVSRYGYIPSIGAALFLASGFMWFWNQKKISLRAAGVAGLIAYLTLNGALVQRVISRWYLPTHQASRSLSQALRAERHRLRVARVIGTWNTGPHTTLVLRHVIAWETALPIGQIHVLRDNEVCPETVTCFRWNKEGRSLEYKAPLAP